MLCVDQKALLFIAGALVIWLIKNVDVQFAS